MGLPTYPIVYLQAFLHFNQCSVRWHTHTKKSAPDPAAKMHLALLCCGTYPRKLMVGWSQKKHLGLSKPVSHIFTCLQFWTTLGLLDRVVTCSHHISSSDLQRKRIPSLLLQLVSQGYILPTPQRCLNQEYEQAQSHTNDLLGMSRNKRERRGLSTPSIRPPPPDTHTHTDFRT